MQQAAILLVLALFGGAAGAGNHIEFASCQLPGTAAPARCGHLEVPENPREPQGRRLKIGVAVLPATGKARPDPLVPLMGGPGESAIGEAAYFADLFAPLRRDHDILLVDQRGTGRSAALHCELFDPQEPAASLRDIYPPAAVERCLRRLREQADLTQYTYTHFANDLEQVRLALGYGKMNLFGGSYGTRAAQVFMRAWPGSVRTAYLGSVVPLDVVTTLTMAKSAQATLDNLFDSCEADSHCHAAFPNLRSELKAVLARLEADDTRPGLPGRGRVVEWMRSMTYRPGTATGLPWIIHQAHEGNFEPLVNGVLANARGADHAVSFGLFFTITCNDDVAFMTDDDIARETGGTLLGDYRARQQQAACAQWPRYPNPEGHRVPVRSSVPTLFVSGDRDGATPLWMTARVAPGFDNRKEVVLRGRGHTDVSDCVPGLYESFVRGGEARGLDATGCRPTPRPPFRIR